MAMDKRNEKAERKLFKLRDEMITENPVLHTGYYIKNSREMMKSGLYDCLNVMPKPVIHHLHD